MPSYITETGLLFATLSHGGLSFQEYYPGLEDILKRIEFTRLPYRRSIKYSHPIANELKPYLRHLQVWGQFQLEDNVTQTIFSVRDYVFRTDQMIFQDRRLPGVSALPVHSPGFQ